MTARGGWGAGLPVTSPTRLLRRQQRARAGQGRQGQQQPRGGHDGGGRGLREGAGRERRHRGGGRNRKSLALSSSSPPTRNSQNSPREPTVAGGGRDRACVRDDVTAPSRRLCRGLRRRSAPGPGSSRGSRGQGSPPTLARSPRRRRSLCARGSRRRLRGPRRLSNFRGGRGACWERRPPGGRGDVSGGGGGGSARGSRSGGGGASGSGGHHSAREDSAQHLESFWVLCSVLPGTGCCAESSPVLG